MMKTLKTVLTSLVLVVLATSGCAKANINDPMLRDSIVVKTKAGEEFTFNVEIALTPGQQQHGLMDRTYLDKSAGMMFLFPDEEMRSFWMRNTLIPLDMLFISHDGTIHHIHSNATPQNDTPITSIKPAMAVLEINGGLSDKLDIQPGDKVIYPAFRNVLPDQ